MPAIGACFELPALLGGARDAGCSTEERSELRRVGRADSVSRTGGGEVIDSGGISLERANGLPGAAFMATTAAARQVMAISISRIPRRSASEVERARTRGGNASAATSGGVPTGILRRVPAENAGMKSETSGELVKAEAPSEC